MRIGYYLLSLVFWLGPVMQAQNTTNESIRRAQSSLEKQDYPQARYLFIEAYRGFAQEGDYKQAIDAGTQAASLYYQENDYQAAFDLCRQMSQLIQNEEQKLQKPLYEQRFQVTKERLRMYMTLKNAAQAQAQLNALENLASQAKDENLSKELLHAQTGYHYTFGQHEQGDAAFQKLVSPYKKKKEYSRVTDHYKELIAMAREANNVPLLERMYENYIVWTDSVRALTAEDRLGALRQMYDQSQQTIQEKEDKLSVKQYMIVGLITFTVILIAALLCLGLLLLRLTVLNKKLKEVIRTTNEHNEQQARFLQRLSVLLAPTLSKLDASAQELRAVAPKQAEEILARVTALRQFTAHVKELSSLGGTLMEPYEISAFNVGSFSQKIVEKIKGDIQPEVNLVTDIPQLEIKTNAEKLEQILSHLLKNATLYTAKGNIRFEFKRKGAHVCQFIITDNGPGIPAEWQENLFKPFHEAKDLAQGDGLGLPICALMANKLNGTLSIDKEYKKGCRFILMLQI